MVLLPVTTVHAWAGSDGARWSVLAGASVQHKAGDWKEIKAVNAKQRELIFRMRDAVPWRQIGSLYAQFSVSPEIAARIERDKEADRARALARRQAQERADLEDARRREAEQKARDEEAARRDEKWHGASEVFEDARRRRSPDREAAREAHRLRAPELREIIERRAIRSLFHFTRLSSLSAILRTGLDQRAAVSTNDNERHDGIREATCLSIGFPNYRLFFKFREKYRDEKWIILVLSIDIISQNLGLFNCTNAANGVCSRQSWAWRATPEALERMFAEEADWANPPKRRADLSLPGYMTTDPQAEVLVVDVIDPRHIRAVAFESEQDHAAWRATRAEAHAAVRIVVRPKLFGPRQDHWAWQEARAKPADE